MLLQKTFHMSQSLEECKSRLANIHSYRRQFAMVTKATVTSSGTLDFALRTLHCIIVACGPIAQSVEQMAFNHWVEGSSPSRITIYFNN